MDIKTTDWVIDNSSCRLRHTTSDTLLWPFENRLSRPILCNGISRPKPGLTIIHSQDCNSSVQQHFICWVSPGHLPVNYPFHSIKCASQQRNEFDIIVQKRGSSLFDKHNDTWLNIIGSYAGLVQTITQTNADLSTTELLATKNLEKVFVIGKIHLFQIAPLRSIPFV